MQYRYAWDQIQNWVNEQIAFHLDNERYRYNLKPKKLPRLNEMGESFWRWQISRYFAAITPQQRLVTLHRLSSAERQLLLKPKQRSLFKEAERLYDNQQRAARYYKALPPQRKAAKIERQRQLHPPKGRTLLDPDVKLERERARNRKESRKHYQCLKADPNRYAAYRERKNAAKRAAKYPTVERTPEEIQTSIDAALAARQERIEKQRERWRKKNANRSPEYRARRNERRRQKHLTSLPPIC